MTTENEIEAVEKQELEAEAEPTRPGPIFVPAVDIFEDAEDITVVADVPGASSDGIDIDLDNGVLTIAADVEDDRSADEVDDIVEWSSGRYYRQFTVSDSIEQSKIEAVLTEGVLRIRLPKVEQAKPRKITVSTS